MATPRKSATSRKKAASSRKKKKAGINWPKIFIFLLLTAVLTISIATAGYVIFFRTVFAQELPAGRTSKVIVYEEPDPPQHFDAVTSAAKPQSRTSLPKVAIIIDDMGYDPQLGAEMLQVPIEMTYSFLPFAPFTESLAEKAFYFGKMIFLHLPLQPESLVVDPGPGTIYVTDDHRTQQEKLRQCLLAVPHAVGVNNHMGSKFTRDRDDMETVMHELSARKLFFIDSLTSSDSVGYDIAVEYGVKTAKRHVFLDNELNVDKICDQLQHLVAIAEKHGSSIGIGHPHKSTFTALSTCSPEYSDRVQFVNIQAILQ